MNREKEGLWWWEAAAAAAVVAEESTVAEDMVEERSGRGLRLFYVPKCQLINSWRWFGKKSK